MQWWRRGRAVRLAVMAGALAGAMGCGASTPTQPTPPPVAAPTLACPAAIDVSTADQTAAITYDPPAAQGGQAPVTVACTRLRRAFPVRRRCAAPPPTRAARSAPAGSR
ncbi:MAG: hypothetical protein R2712_18315 [Vicinamibacterales bacterium]